MPLKELCNLVVIIKKQKQSSGTVILDGDGEYKRMRVQVSKQSLDSTMNLPTSWNMGVLAVIRLIPL